MTAAELVHAALQLLGCSCPDPTAYEPTVEGLQLYLDASGINHHLSADEMARARDEGLARRLGYGPWLLPPRELWPWGALLRRLHRDLREAARGPAWVYNWHRPGLYNDHVKGKPQSDHLAAAAFDIRFEGRRARRRAEQIVNPIWQSGLLRMSLGRGGTMLHVGVFAPVTMQQGLARRQWRYGSADG